MCASVGNQITAYIHTHLQVDVVRPDARGDCGLEARRRLQDFGQRVPDPRLRARSLSLIKILHKQEALESQGGWYFGEGGGSQELTASTQDILAAAASAAAAAPAR